MPNRQEAFVRSLGEVLDETLTGPRTTTLDVVAEGASADDATRAIRPMIDVLPPWPPAKILQSPNPTAQRIVEVSLEFFANRGYLDTSLQDIANEVGILKGSLYHYIRGKQDLLSAIFSLEHARARQLVSDINAQPTTGLDAVINFIRSYLESVLHDARSSRVTERDWEMLAPEERDALLGLTMSYLKYLKQNILIAQTRGEISATHQAGLVATAIFGMLEWPHSWFRPDTRLNGTILADSFVHVLLDGLRIR